MESSLEQARAGINKRALQGQATEGSGRSRLSSAPSEGPSLPPAQVAARHRAPFSCQEPGGTRGCISLSALGRVQLLSRAQLFPAVGGRAASSCSGFCTVSRDQNPGPDRGVPSVGLYQAILLVGKSSTLVWAPHNILNLRASFGRLP